MAEGNRDIVLAPGEYAYVKDTTKGLVSTIVGPQKTSMSNTDQPVVWDKVRFKMVSAEDAIRLNAIAPEGFYIALYNPAAGEKHPSPGTSTTEANLQVGYRVNIHGPANFALYPGQMADVIKGHQLRSNQYLLAQVYNDAAATANWQQAVLKPQQTPTTEPAAAVVDAKAFTPGQMLIIRGTDVAFFMPPTGVKVVAADASGKQFVRDAVTLERLEYCILLDERGSKRFVQGPSVVFPEPTETFIEKDGSRKFRAIELNLTSGIYVKVIADYEDNGQAYKAGDELFITGAEQAIYFQREEHSIIRYGEQTKHYAIAVPSGEGRYVLNRLTGAVGLVKGPTMLLCDPREEVITLRTLSEDTVRLWYPGNDRVLELNKARALEAVEAAALRTAETSKALLRSRSISSAASYADNSIQESGVMNYTTSKQIAGDQFQRGGTFTPPRTVTLDTKYDGAVALSIWTGYAVQVVSKTGTRRVVRGPEHILLEYDETLARLELSTGKPKTDDRLLQTVYLRVANNKISDILTVDSADMVPVQLTLSYRVNFEGAADKWFEVENYIKLLTDNLRSRLRNMAKRSGIESLYLDPVNLVRDTLLGQAGEEGHRPGLLFTENGMRVTDVEVLDVTIKNSEVATLLLNAQKIKLTETVKTKTLTETLPLLTKVAEIERAKATVAAETTETLQLQKRREFAAVNLTEIQRITNELEEQGHTEDLVRAELEQNKLKDDAKLAQLRAEADLFVERMQAETASIKERAGALSPEMAAAISALSDKALVERISKDLAPIAAMQGVSAAEVLSSYFAGTPIQSVLQGLAARSTVPLMAGKDKG